MLAFIFISSIPCVFTTARNLLFFPKSKLKFLKSSRSLFVSSEGKSTFKSRFRLFIGTGALLLETEPLSIFRLAFKSGFWFLGSLNLPFKLKNKSLFPSIFVSFTQPKYCGGKMDNISFIVVFSDAALIFRLYPSFKILTKPVNFKGSSLILNSFFLKTKVKALVLILVIKSA